MRAGGGEPGYGGRLMAGPGAGLGLGESINL